MRVMGLDLSLAHSGYAIFESVDKFVHWDVIEPCSSLSTPNRVLFTVGVIRAVVLAHGVTDASIEDYAYSQFGVSNSIAQIAENAGAVKVELVRLGVNIHVYSISAIKNTATGMGKATKGQMADAYRKLTHKRKVEDENMIDAFFCAYHHYAVLSKDA